MSQFYYDNRGFVGSIYRKDSKYQYAFDWKEDRMSYSAKAGTVRGLHSSPGTYKLATCLLGKIQLVIYNIGTGEWEEHLLSPELGNEVLIFPNSLNGHQTLEDNSILYYKWDQYYNLSNQLSVSPICVNWPLQITEMSDRDKNAMQFADFVDKSPPALKFN